jgi:hypothetical protein
METRGRAGKMKRRNEFTLRRRGILGLMPAPNVGQYKRQAGNSRCEGQVAGVTDAATIGVGRSVVMMYLFGNGGGGLETGKQGQQEQYEDCTCQLPSRDIGAHH